MRVVLLGSEGSGYQLAESAESLLCLLAVGYRELADWTLGDVPDDPIPTDTLAPWRCWLESEFGLVAPQAWTAVGDDEFSVWLEAQLGWARPSVEPPAGRGTTITGEITTLLDLLEVPDGPDLAASIAKLIGITLADRLRASVGVLRSAGLEIQIDRHGLAVVWARVAGYADESAARDGLPVYPRPAALIEGLGPDSTMDDALRLLGEPEKQGKRFLRYVVSGRHLHLEFSHGHLSLVTLMTQTP